ncbi:aldehyde dehydrogenase family protein [Hyalangium minutum]|uniref:CoA-acylating propionaldehyde dehydrogenase n=1 Tax=Hyalangium minutum TaxID=394096 RepID=A0A085WNX7_9BACT|nr:aldehyde dehydrogenase family protein [Hyalangium minutum]KFE69390.1 CoA-acylating propionaldehyde dehydrogenase [Hyalangium minutum]
MSFDAKQIDAIVDQVVRKLSKELSDLPQPVPAPAQPPQGHADDRRGSERRYGTAPLTPEARPPVPSRAPAFHKGRKGIFDDLDAATTAARAAFEEWGELSLEVKDRAIEAMRETTRRAARELSEMAVKETGLGRVEDKIKKNLLCANKTPGTEILKPVAFTGDHGLALLERAPYGVIGSITPTTNPTETIINNGIGMVAGGNAVVFNVHPSAKRVSAYHIQLLNEAIVSAGGPENLLCALAEPTIDSAQALMKHKNVRLLVVTGGPAVVRAAMNSGKRAIAAGPGNPPAVVDETAHIARAAKDIVDGASLDNNIVCIVEKEVFAVASIADELKAQMERYGAYEVTGAAIHRLEKLVVHDGHPVKDWVGKDAEKIADAAGIRVPQGTRLLFAEVDATHPFIQAELLLPVMGFTRLRNVEDCITAAVQAEHGFGHTATMHSTNVDHLSTMARLINTSIFVKNGPSFAGLGMTGEGYTSFTIASPTGEGLTTALSFTRERRCTLKDSFRIV